jgi:hypothetical protein
LQGLLHSEELDEQLIEQFRVASSLRDWPAYTEEHAFVNVLLTPPLNQEYDSFSAARTVRGEVDRR